jgi:peptidoglycan L-alanyl-D-glutamate endopeptidase CwlK
MNKFILGIRSKLNLRGVHPDLVAVVNKAIEITGIDFTVTEGLRSKQRQEQLVKSGASKTMNSRHLTGHAVDLAAIVKGKVRWDWELYFQIASAMQQAARDLLVPIVWGGVWDTKLNDLGNDLQAEHTKYIMRQKKLGKRAFGDAPHFELSRKTYPATTKE